MQESFWRRDPERAAERIDLQQKAVTAYRQALELRPRDSLAMLRLGKAYTDLGENDLALQTYLQALEVDPNSAEVNLRLGLFYQHIGDLEKAKAALEKSRRISEGPNRTADLNLWTMGK